MVIQEFHHLMERLDQDQEDTLQQVVVADLTKLVQVLFQEQTVELVDMVGEVLVDQVDHMETQYQGQHQIIGKVVPQQQTPDLVVVDVVETTIQEMLLMDTEVPVLMVL
tara:strand:- start:169 stop:495 length:327 start_codon:yes stop_codon:yes gene_type:complete